MSSPPVEEVDVWFAGRPGGALPETMERTLSAAERQRAARFATGELRADYVFAHAVLRQVLSRYLACAPGEIEFAADAYGKPRLAAEGLWFNLSHSRGTIAVAVTHDGPVGIDIEQIRDVPDREAIAARYSFRDTEGTFFECWTRMEARAKASGRGLGTDSATGWWAENLAAPAGYAAAVSMERGPARIRYQKL